VVEQPNKIQGLVTIKTRRIYVKKSPLTLKAHRKITR